MKKNKIQLANEKQELTFERLSNEPAIAFNYFCVFRDLGTRRSCRKVAEAVGVGEGKIREYSARYKWQERIRLWMDEIDKERREAYLKEIKDMSKRHARQSEIFQRVLSIPATEILRKMQNGDKSFTDFQNLPVEALFDKTLKSAQVLSSVIDIERKSKGEPSEIIKQEIEQNQKHEIRIVLPAMPSHLQYLLENTGVDVNDDDRSTDD